MSLDLIQMRKLVRRGLGGLSIDDLPDPDVDLYLNMSLWELESKFPFKEKECRSEAMTVMGQGEYGLPDTMDAIVSVSILVDGERRKLRRMTFDAHDELYNELPDKYGVPTHYKRRDNALVLWPIPNAVYEINLVFWKSVASLLEGIENEPNLPRNWHEIVVEGAVVRGHFFQEDYDEATKAKNFQVGNIRSSVPTEAKEERDSRYAGLQPWTGREMSHADPATYYYRKSLYGGEIP